MTTLPPLEEMKEALSHMWTPEFGELELTVHHTLTEPTCPTAIVRTDEDSGPSWRADCGTIEEAIFQAIAATYITLVLKKPKPLTFPARNSDEDERLRKFFAALEARDLKWTEEGRS